jgi:hypothetical protein
VGPASTDELELQDCLVQGNARAALLFVGAGGTITSSVLRSNKLGIVLEQGAAPVLDKSLVYESNGTDGVSSGLGLKLPAPPGL